jgi:N-acetylmuramic acid 6-phosphate etherase
MSQKLVTEALLKSAHQLDRMRVREILDLIHAEDRVAYEAVGKVLPEIEQAVDVLACVVGGGGRWFNVGAGTSGRLGVLDASEIPPTFGMAPNIVQGIVAGGDRALRSAIEGAEDDADKASWELRERGLGMGDAVVAVSASGSTPFALGALEAAHEASCRSVAITCNYASPLAEMAEIAIVPEVGPEVIAGSTRMKGGLAQKMILHLLSTTVMVRLGRVEGNQMTNVMPASAKLRRRAVGILVSLGKVDEETAKQLLRENGGSVQAALQALRSVGRTG